MSSAENFNFEWRTLMVHEKIMKRGNVLHLIQLLNGVLCSGMNFFHNLIMEDN